MKQLHALGTETLRRLLKLLESDTQSPSSSVLEAKGLGAAREAVQHGLGGLPDIARAPVVRAILREREQAAKRKPELVWTGPDAAQSEVRRTAVVLRETLAASQHHVLIAGYSFDHGVDLLAPLHKRMLEAGVSVDLYLSLKQPATAHGAPAALTEADAELQIAEFFESNWPWTDVVPSVWYDRRVLAGKVFTSLHAKCVVVDKSIVYVTSANFTQRANERNVEVGLRMRDSQLAERLCEHFAKASAAGEFVRG